LAQSAPHLHYEVRLGSGLGTAENADPAQVIKEYLDSVTAQAGVAARAQAQAQIDSGLIAPMGGEGAIGIGIPSNVGIPQQQQLPGAAGAVPITNNINIDLSGATVNAAADIERIARAAADAAGVQTYEQVKSQLVYVFENAQAKANNSLAMQIG